MRQALAAGDPLPAAHVVEGKIHTLLDREEKARLEFLLDLLPADLVAGTRAAPDRQILDACTLRAVTRIFTLAG